MDVLQRIERGEIEVNCRGIDITISNTKTTAELLRLARLGAELEATSLRPATRFLTNSLDDQFIHVRRELEEARDAKIDYSITHNADDFEHLAEELVDLQMSCETMLTCMGLNADQRNDARRKVIEKNRRRGYYEVSDK